MTMRSLKIVSLITVACVPAFLPAQMETTGKEEQRLEALARSQGEWAAAPKSKLSVGFRVMNSGGQVNFQNLGAVPNALTIPPGSDGLVTRVYDNGNVVADSIRAAEKDSSGNVTSTPGGRYDVFSVTTVDVYDANGNVTGSKEVTTRIGDYLSYTPGMTRQWTAASDEQLDRAGYVSFSRYHTSSDGGSAMHKQGPTGGVEFLFSRDVGRATRFLQWGVVAGVTLNDINSKSSGTVASTLHTYTDYYSTNGQVINPERLVNPNFSTFFDADGNPIAGTTYETTTAIGGVPDASISGDAPPIVGGVAVDGRWQVKGAYFMVKFGPSVRALITDRLGLTASLGLAGAYAGTRYTASESFDIPNVTDGVLETNESSVATKFLSGYFADLNLEWAANDVMGLFGGVTAQQLSDYEQKLGDRSAKIDLGTSVGIRGGVSIRF